MKDLRCMVGLHHFALPKSPATDRSAYDAPGVKVECTRCEKAKVIRAGPPSTHHGPGMGATGGGSGG